ncbi:MAG TPA: glycosyltransferase family 4 protein [Planctomycetota bacterium]|nr:glycosyltransferase family 4 protein [Planctomycetota bacterium]
MKIAIVHPSLAVKGGADNIVVWLAWGLGRRGHDVTIFTGGYDAALWPGEYTAGLNVVVLRHTERFLRSTRLALTRLGLVLSRKLRGFDLVNCHNWPANIWVARARRMSGRFPKVVWYCQEPSRKLYWEITDTNLVAHISRAGHSQFDAHLREEAERDRRAATRSSRRMRSRARDIEFDRAALEMMDSVLVNSRFSKGSFEAVYGVSPALCYLGIPFGDAAAPSSGKGDYFCVVSPLRTRKNVQNVVEAMNVLVNQWNVQGLKLRIVGDGVDRGALEGLVARYGLRPEVEFSGHLPDGELPGVYARARLAVYVPIDEPFGLIPLEAMACGTPVIASDHGGSLETVVHGETGLHVNPFQPEAIAAAIRELYFDDARIAAMGARGRALVRERFGLDGFLDRFEEMALGKRGLRRRQDGV